MCCAADGRYIVCFKSFEGRLIKLIKERPMRDIVTKHTLGLYKLSQKMSEASYIRWDAKLVNVCAALCSLFVYMCYTCIPPYRNEVIHVRK